MSTKVPGFLFTICFYSYSCKYIVKVKKMNRKFQINLSNGLGCNVIGWVIDKIFVVKNHIFGNTIANWQWKTECFFLSALLRFFNKPCTTAIVKRTGAPSICEPSRCYSLAYDLIFLWVILREFLLNIMFVKERIKKNKLDSF